MRIEFLVATAREQTTVPSLLNLNIKIRKGEPIALSEFTEGEDLITKQVIEHGGLFEFNVAPLQKKVFLPPLETKLIGTGKATAVGRLPGTRLRTAIGGEGGRGQVLKHARCRRSEFHEDAGNSPERRGLRCNGVLRTGNPCATVRVAKMLQGQP